MEDKKRYTVMTYLFGGYEDLKEIEKKDEDAEYICITDNPELKSETWKIITAADGEDLDGFEKTLLVRYHPFHFCNTDIVITVDASVKILDSLKPLVDDFEAGYYEYGVIPHSVRNNFLDEYNEWIQTRDYNAQRAMENLQFFQKYMYPINGNKDGLIQATVIIQHRSPVAIAIDEMTFRTCKFLANHVGVERIDQIVLTFVLNAFFSYVPTMFFAEDCLHSSLMQWHDHVGTPIPYEKKDRKYYRNGEEISVKIYE